VNQLNLPTSTNNSVAITGPELGRQRIDEVIAKGRDGARRVFKYVMENQPNDKLVNVDKLSFEPKENHIEVLAPTLDSERIHRNALGQMAERVSLPMAYVNTLQGHGAWGIELLAENLHKLFGHNKSRALMRSVNGEVRGFLSDKYRRLDSGPFIESFVKACSDVDALPYQGYTSDTKVSIQAIIPKVYEPVKNEYMAYGVTFENSDFGNGAMQVQFFILRLQCLNGMIGESNMRQVHLGKRLEDEDFSKKTQELNVKTILSAMQDVVRAQLSSERIDTMQAFIAKSAAEKLTDDRRGAVLESLKRSMTKAEIDRMTAKFNEPDVELLPPGNNMWRLSQALSWLAGEEEDAERKLELQKQAGKLLITTN